MRTVLNARASIGCGHGGSVQVSAGQSTLTASGSAILVAGDLDGRPISGCLTKPAPGGIVPCTLVVSVTGGTAETLSVGGRAALLDTVGGQTNGNPPGALAVLLPGQTTLRAS